jgi:GntR family transcriptional regulator, transcriptional repressor for pyruvate dehydrogenase complex
MSLNAEDLAPTLQVWAEATVRYTRHTICSSAKDRSEMPQNLQTFTSVPREPRLSEKVADTITEAIVSQQLASGTRLPTERELGEQFGVSRTVIREAIKALTAKGLVEVQSGSGLRVTGVQHGAVTESLSLYLRSQGDGRPVEYEKVHEIRAVLEVEMAAAAADRRTDAEIEVLTEACELVEAAKSNVDLAARRDVEFHRAIGKATHNEFYVVLLDALGGVLVSVRRTNLAKPTGRRRTLAQHREILEAIVAGDSRAARERMRAHLDSVMQLWTA